MKKNISILLFLIIIIHSFFIANDYKLTQAITKNNDIKNSTVTIVDNDTDLSVKLSSDTDEDYNPHNRIWNGIPTVITSGQNIFVAWYTGGLKEPDINNYVVVAASDDNGETWIDPFIIIDPVDDKEKTMVPVFYYNGAGDLWLLYAQETVGRKRDYYALKLLNADGPLSEITHEEPIVIHNRNGFTKPTVLSDGRIMYISSGEDGYANVHISNDDGYSFYYYSSIQSTSKIPNKRYSEAAIVELSDNTLWMLSRLESGWKGGVEQAFSSDGGENWTISDGNLPEPLIGPGSRFAFSRLKSGALIFVTNDSKTTRNQLTAYLSFDEGITWPHSIVIDRYISSYPEIYQSEDERIFITYDKGRYTENGIRLTILTEKDIIAGEFVSVEHKDKITIAKINNSYADIISVNNAFQSKLTYPVGTESSKIRNSLLTSFVVTDSNGNSHELTGTWSSAGYKSDIEGTYVLSFITSLPSTLIDSHDKLFIKVTLENNTIESGRKCSSDIYGAEIMIIGILFIFGIKNKIYYKQNKRRK